MDSPCIKVCTINASSGLCAGCGRSLDEIARWSSMTDAERRNIMRHLPDRLAAMPSSTPVITSAKQA